MDANQIDELFNISNTLSQLWNALNYGPNDPRTGEIDTITLQEKINEINNVILHTLIPDNWEEIVAKAENRFPRG
jgi:hypothetical protein